MAAAPWSVETQSWAERIKSQHKQGLLQGKRQASLAAMAGSLPLVGPLPLQGFYFLTLHLSFPQDLLCIMYFLPRYLAVKSLCGLILWEHMNFNRVDFGDAELLTQVEPLRRDRTECRWTWGHRSTHLQASESRCLKQPPDHWDWWKGLASEEPCSA